MTPLPVSTAVSVLGPILRVPGIPPHGISHSRAWTPRGGRRVKRFRVITYGSREHFERALRELGLGAGRSLDANASHEQVAARVDELMRIYRQEETCILP
jgi:hypothetical protein